MILKVCLFLYIGCTSNVSYISNIDLILNINLYMFAFWDKQKSWLCKLLELSLYIVLDNQINWPGLMTKSNNNIITNTSFLSCKLHEQAYK